MKNFPLEFKINLPSCRDEWKQNAFVESAHSMCTIYKPFWDANAIVHEQTILLDLPSYLLLICNPQIFLAMLACIASTS